MCSERRAPEGPRSAVPRQPPRLARVSDDAMTEPKRRKIVESDAREIIARVYHYLKNELEVTLIRNPEGCDFSHLRNIRQRTADATGSSVRTVSRVLREERVLNEERVLRKERALDTGGRFPSPRRGRPRPNTHVEREILEYINTNDEPDLKQLRSILAERIGYDGTFAALRRTVLDLGYEIDKNSKVVMTSWIVVKEEHSSDQEIQEDVPEHGKPQFVWRVNNCDPGEPATAEEVPTVRIKSEPEPDDDYTVEVREVDVEIQVKQEPDSSS